MAYNAALADRIRNALAKERGVVEKEMFGGIAFMLQGHMCCGIVKEDLLVRVGPVRHEALLREPHARPMDFAGRPMVGFLYVAPDGCRTDAALARWVRRTVEFVTTLPPKKAPTRRVRAKSRGTRPPRPRPQPKTQRPRRGKAKA